MLLLLGGALAYGAYKNPERTTLAAAEVDGLPQGILWSVPDVYSARFGAAYALSQARRRSLSLGARLDGIPMKDLIGGDFVNYVLFVGYTLPL